MSAVLEALKAPEFSAVVEVFTHKPLLKITFANGVLESDRTPLNPVTSLLSAGWKKCDSDDLTFWLLYVPPTHTGEAMGEALGKDLRQSLGYEKVQVIRRGADWTAV
jgi:hypothetical protein